MANNDPTLYDVRVIKYHLRRRTLTPEQLAEHLESLPDEAEHGEPTTTRMLALHGGGERKAAEASEG